VHGNRRVGRGDSQSRAHFGGNSKPQGTKFLSEGFANNMPTIIDTRQHRAENTNTPSENPRPLCAHMNILVAEDDAPLAEFLQQKLGQERFAVTNCVNGRRSAAAGSGAAV